MNMWKKNEYVKKLSLLIVIIREMQLKATLIAI